MDHLRFRTTTRQACTQALGFARAQTLRAVPRVCVTFNIDVVLTEACSLSLCGGG